MLANLRDTVALPTVLVLFLALVVTTAAVGGSRPAFLAAVGGFLAANWFFTPPFHRLSGRRGRARRGAGRLPRSRRPGEPLRRYRRPPESSRPAGRAAEAQTLATLAATTSEDDPLPSLLGHLRDAFGLETAALLAGRDGHWSVEATSGEGAPTRPEDANLVEPAAA